MNFGREPEIISLPISTFTLLSSPLRATGCRLMHKADGGFMIRTANPSLKINQKKADQVAKMVIEQIHAADISFT